MCWMRAIKKYFTPEKEDSQEEEEDDSRFDLPKGTYPIQLVSSELQEKGNQSAEALYPSQSDPGYDQYCQICTG